MKNNEIELEIYIADLSAYNSGFLHGTWFDVLGGGDLTETIEKLKKNSPVVDCEEFLIHDYSTNINGLVEHYGEASPFHFVKEIEEIMETIEKEKLKAFFVWKFHTSGSIENIHNFHESYSGVWESFSEFSENCADEMMACIDGNEIMKSYFNYEKYERELEYGYFYEHSGNQCFIFRNC